MSLVPWRQKRPGQSAANRAETSLARLRSEMDSLFERFFRDPWGWPEFPATGLATPRMDLAESENAITVTVELPGVDPKDVAIDVTGNSLTVRGEKKQQKEDKRKDYHFVERQYGCFQRTVQLPSTIDPDRVEARYKDGVLTIEIAKRQEAKPKRIPVRNA